MEPAQGAAGPVPQLSELHLVNGEQLLVLAGLEVAEAERQVRDDSPAHRGPLVGAHLDPLSAARRAEGQGHALAIPDHVRDLRSCPMSCPRP